ncbi:MAG: DegT/DnrJ/EryC1/StrS family aminotransferase [Bacteroidota bacterium]
MKKIEMVDLKSQYLNIKHDVDAAIQNVIDTSTFINGPKVSEFKIALAEYLSVKHVISCANGTDALQIALMALDLQPGDEVIVPCFTYAATAEVILLLKLKPVLIEVDPETFNITTAIIAKAITPRTRAIVPVHLFGQCSDMEPIMELAKVHNLFVVEDTAQALGAVYTFSDGSQKSAGTIGHIGCTSFFPSKNLGCYGDGGAIYTNDDELAIKIQKIANHGQSKKYYHELVGVNSRLDTLQAAILIVKLKSLKQYTEARNKVANYYDEKFKDIKWITIPKRQANSTHVFHQYTVVLEDGIEREALISYLKELAIPSMIYYPMPLHFQQAFKQKDDKEGDFPVSEKLCKTVLSLPIHTEMEDEQLDFIIKSIKLFKTI